MKIIDFDNEFRQYLEKWIEDNADSYGDYEEMESGMVNVYAKWLNTPADFLGGVCPLDYYSNMDDVKELIDLLMEHKKKGVSIPDLLLDKISEIGEEAKPYLADLIKSDLDLDKDDTVEIKMLSVNLLSEVDDAFMHETYVEMLSENDIDNEFAVLLIEKLEYGNKNIVDKIFEILVENESEVVRGRFADVLVHYRGEDRIYKFLVDMFNTSAENTGLYAAYLGKYDDDRAIEILTESLDWQSISYIDYLEIKQSLERFGEEVNHKRDFSGDSYFESLRHLEQ